MKQVTLKVSNCSVAQWSTLLLELNLMAKAWTKFGPEIQAASAKRQADPGPWHKQQAASLEAASATNWPCLYRRIDYERNNKNSRQSRLRRQANE